MYVCVGGWGEGEGRGGNERTHMHANVTAERIKSGVTEEERRREKINIEC